MQEDTLEELKNSEQVPNHVFKIVLVGDSGVGKSNILSRYTKNVFDKNIKSIVGVEFASKLFRRNDNIISVNIWDTAGQERFSSITSAYYKGAHGALIVYDITKKHTFDNIEKWYNELVSMCSRDLVVFLIGNKCDLTDLRVVKPEEAIEKAQKLKVLFMETSALNCTNIEEAFKRTISELFLKKFNQTSEYIEQREKEKDRIDFKTRSISVKRVSDKKKEKKKCC